MSYYSNDAVTRPRLAEPGVEVDSINAPLLLHAEYCCTGSGTACELRGCEGSSFCLGTAAIPFSCGRWCGLWTTKIARRIFNFFYRNHFSRRNGETMFC